MAKNEFSDETTILLAIHRTCLHCMSNDKDAVENCPAGPDAGLSRCMLWKYRQGPLSAANHAKRYILATIHEHCKKCIGSEKEIDKCTTDGRGGYRKCLLFDHRNGNRRLKNGC